MSFFTSIGKAIAKGCEYLDKATTYVGKKFGEAVSAAVEGIASLFDSTPSPTFSDTSSFTATASRTSGEEEKKARKQAQDKAITEYQKKVRQKANSREALVTERYRNIYDNYLKMFQPIFAEDIIADINNFVDMHGKAFKNIMRDSINSRVSPANHSWQRLTKSDNVSMSAIQKYCNQAYTDANNELLELLQTTIEETNAYISHCVVKYNDDRAKTLADMKESLIKLSADEESAASELRKIAEEFAVAEYISHMTLQPTHTA